MQCNPHDIIKAILELSSVHQGSIADPYGCQVPASYCFACKGVIFPAKRKKKSEKGHLLPGGPDLHITPPTLMSLKRSLDLNLQKREVYGLYLIWYLRVCLRTMMLLHGVGLDDELSRQ